MLMGMPSCAEVTRLADALLADELGRGQRLRLRVHLFMCVHCARYVRQLRALLGALPRLHGPASEDEVAAVMAGIESH